MTRFDSQSHIDWTSQHALITQWQGSRCERPDGLSCRKSTPCHQRHSMLNEIVWSATRFLTYKEPTELILLKGKCLDAATLISCSRSTVPDTYAASHTNLTLASCNTAHWIQSRPAGVQGTQQFSTQLHSQLLPIKQHQRTLMHTSICRRGHPHRA